MALTLIPWVKLGLPLSLSSKCSSSSLLNRSLLRHLGTLFLFFNAISSFSRIESANFSCQWQESKYFWHCGSCVVSTQLLSSSTTMQKQPEATHKWISMIMFQKVLFTKAGHELDFPQLHLNGFKLWLWIGMTWEAFKKYPYWTSP